MNEGAEYYRCPDSSSEGSLKVIQHLIKCWMHSDLSLDGAQYINELLIKNVIAVVADVYDPSSV